jgi:hypothetical protein
LRGREREPKKVKQFKPWGWGKRNYIDDKSFKNRRVRQRESLERA